MTTTFKPTLESFEDRCLPSNSPITPAALHFAQVAVANYYNLSKTIAFVESQLHRYGVSSLSELLQKNLSYNDRQTVRADIAAMKKYENQVYNSEAIAEAGIRQLRNLEATTYKAYNHTAFNQDVATFNSFDKAFWNQMIVFESLI